MLKGEQWDVRTLLQEGDIKSCELIPWGSNYTFLVTICKGSQECRGVYKPRSGEIPLWDFPAGTLYKRERAAYLLSQALGWDFVPVTVIRDGPYGVGSLQLHIDHDARHNYFTMRKTHAYSLRLMCAFDWVANNADRKASHCIQGRDGKLWGIDHGLTFHSQPKLRTVMWDLCGEAIPQAVHQALRSLHKRLESPEGDLAEVEELLEPSEVEALAKRVEWFLGRRTFPMLDPYRNTPRPPF